MTASEREDLGIETEEKDRELWIHRVLKERLDAITTKELADETFKDPELGPILEEKGMGVKNTKLSKGPYGKMWEDLKERDGYLTREKQIMIPMSLQRRAIELAHEGHQQTDGTLRQLRETMWFRDMRNQVQLYVDTCKCAAANPRNPTPPMKTRPAPLNLWEVTAVDFKGPIGAKQFYLHTQMCLYSRYMDNTMRRHGRPKEIWSDGGPPYNGHKWDKWVKSCGSTPKKTTPYHPPANGMVERFNQNLKLVIHAATAENKYPMEEVKKYVATYRNTPHRITGEKTSKLLYGRDIKTKLPRITKTVKGKHHKNAKRNERRAKRQRKKTFDTRKKAKLVPIKVGDQAYIRELRPITVKGPWEADPYTIVHIFQNQITGERDCKMKMRYRGDWKLVKPKPEHLKTPTSPNTTTNLTTPTTAPTQTENPTPNQRQMRPRENQPRYNQTRTYTKRVHPQPQLDPTLFNQPKNQNNQTPPNIPNQQAPPNPPQPPPPPPQPRKDRHKCPRCHTLFKMWQGERMCACEAAKLKLQMQPYITERRLDLHDENEDTVGTIAYIRGIMDHPAARTNQNVADLIGAVIDTMAMRSPLTSSSDEAPMGR